MTRDEARVILENRERTIYYLNYCWYGQVMSCADNCCDWCYNSIEESLDDIEDYCGGRWEKVS